MNKRGLTKYIFTCITAIISFYFMITSDTGLGQPLYLSMIFIFLFALTIFMFFNKDKIKKNKFMYDVVLLLLMIFTTGCFLYYLYNEIICYFDINCSINLDSRFIILYSMLLFIMLLFGLGDIFNKTNKVNDILTIAVSLLIILIHVRYYLDSNFIHRIDDTYIQYSYYYVTQNYVYFTIMYVIVMLHWKVNNHK